MDTLNKKQKPMKFQEKSSNQVQSRVLHLDMDAFFAAIEQRDTPPLRNKPVIVGGPYGSRGVVSTCSYEAREYGVRSAMPLKTAQQLCPHAIFLVPDGRKYIHASKKVMEILNRFSPKVEPISVDEAYMDIYGLERLYNSESEYAGKIKAAIYDELRLTCSIGIAPTKILAKLASGLQKPDGLIIIDQNNLETQVYPLPVTKLWGIGQASEKALHQLGIKTIGELAGYPEAKLKKVFGKNGSWMKQIAMGQLDSPVLSREETPLEKSVGHEHTFWNDTNDYEEIRAHVLFLIQRVGRRLRKKKLRGRTITLKLRYENFQTQTHRTSLKCHTSNESEIFVVTEELFNQIYENGRKVRLIGVSVSNLVQKDVNRCGLLFSDEQLRIKTDQKLIPSIDRIKDSFGEHAIWRASTLDVFESP